MITKFEINLDSDIPLIETVEIENTSVKNNDQHYDSFAEAKIALLDMIYKKYDEANNEMKKIRNYIMQLNTLKGE
jgi:hypothetical protein